MTLLSAYPLRALAHGASRTTHTHSPFQHELRVSTIHQLKALIPQTLTQPLATSTCPLSDSTSHTSNLNPKSSPHLPPILPNSFVTKVWEGSKGPLALRRSTMTLAEGGMHPCKHLLYLPKPQLAIEKMPGLTGGKAGSHFGRKNIFRQRTEWIIWDQSEKQTTEVFTKSVLSPLFPGQPPRVFIFWFPPALPKQCNMHLWYLNEVFLKYSLLNHQPHKLFLKNK